MRQIKRSVCLVLALIVAMTMMLGALAAPSVEENIDRAMEFYRTELAPSFENGDLVADVWELLCVTQAGKADEAEYQFMVTEGAELTERSTPTDYAKKILAYILLEKDCTQLAGELAAMQTEEGAFVSGESTAVTNTSFAVLALLAAKAHDVEVSFDCDKAVAAIAAQAKADKGYNDYGEEGNVDTTGMVLLGLAAAEANGCEAAASAVDDAAGFIRSTLKDTGYFVGSGMYDSANACSQAYAIIGLIAAGEDLTDASLQALLACQDANGGFWYQEDRVEGQWPFAPDQMSTHQAIMALCDYQSQSSFLVSLTQKQAPVPESSQPESLASTEQSVAQSTTESTIESAASDSSVLRSSAPSSNPKTGDEGIDPIVWIVLGIAVVAVLVVALLPMFTKKKDNDKATPDDHDQNIQ